jgi:metacaspase-1
MIFKSNIFWFKPLIISILIVLLPLFGKSNNQKKALIITIGKYQEGNGWDELSAGADLILMKETFKNQGFLASNILTISESNATKKGIVGKVEELINLAQKGDKIVIHFSGHGQQLQDLNGDENDRLDEAIVPYDAPSKIQANYHGEKHIIDDEIHEWIIRLKAKIGSEGHLLLILDSCHSGTASRGKSIVRGGKSAIIFNDKYLKVKYLEDNKSDFYEDKIIEKQPAKFVMFTGAAASQQNHQMALEGGKQIGSLSYSVAVAFQKMSKGDSYESLFARVRDVMHERRLAQTPTIEGDKNVEVFDGDIVAQEPYFQLKKIMESGKKIIKLTKGQLADVFEGAKFDFLPKGSQPNKNTKPIARGRVIEANSFESTIEIEEGNLPEKESEVWGFQTEQAFGNYKIGVRFGVFNNEELRKNLAEELNTKKLISWNNTNPDLEIIEENDSIKFMMVSTATVYAQVKISPNIKRVISEKIIDFGRAKVISSLTLSNPDFRVAINLRHIEKTKRQNNGSTPIFIEDSSATYPVFKTNEKGWFTIKNVGNNPFYFTLLDIQPDGKISVILPDERLGYGIENIRLLPNQIKEFAINSFTPPLGIEKFKVIMTPDYQDFSFLQTNTRHFANKGQTTESPLQALFMDLTDGSMQRTLSRGNSNAIIPSTGGTASFTFKIVDGDK